MGNIIHGQFGRPRKIIQSSLSVNLDQFTLTVDGEDWLVVTLNGAVVQIVPIKLDTAPEPKRLAKVIRLAKERLENGAPR